MPTKPKRPCTEPGCPELNCKKHARDRFREHSTKRGYNYHWEVKFRPQFLIKNPLCADCKKAGRIKAAKEVHHILKIKDRPDLKYDEENCMALCKSCHAKRTARGE